MGVYVKCLHCRGKLNIIVPLEQTFKGGKQLITEKIGHEHILLMSYFFIHFLFKLLQLLVEIKCYFLNEYVGTNQIQELPVVDRQDDKYHKHLLEE